MKRIWGFFLLCLFLSGCKSTADAALSLRQRVLKAQSVQFEAEITADYGDTLSVFTLDCQGSSQGDVTFRVLSPESIEGITGTVKAGKGALTFDDTALSFPLLADEQLSPISAPWLFLRVLRGGNLLSQGAEGYLTRLTFRDGFREEDLLADVWINGDGDPVRTEFLHRGNKILSIDLRSFRTQSDPGA